MCRLLVALALACAACAGAQSADSRHHPSAAVRPQHPWEASERIGDQPGSRRDPAGYPDPDGPRVLPSAAPRDTAGESRGALGQRRVLAGRGRAFIAGIAASTGVLPLRGLTWPGDARVSEAGGDSVAFATAWTAGRQVAPDECARGGARTALRLVGVFRARGEALLLDGRVEQQGERVCVPGTAARARLTAFMDDLELYARGAVREGAAVPDRG
jgi:hypothetical protein